MDMEMNEFPVAGVRLVIEKVLVTEEPISSPENVLKLLKKEISDYDREILVVVNLNTRNRPINMSFVAVGGKDMIAIDATSILKASVLSNASKVIIAHNHPGGSLEPSRDDWATTNKLIDAFGLMNIQLLDSVIIAPGHENLYSMKADGQMRDWLFESVDPKKEALGKFANQSKKPKIRDDFER